MRRRLLSTWRLKAALTAGLSVGFCLLYFGLQRHPWRAPWPVPTTPLDALIPFSAAWAWVYQSLYLLTPVAPWLADSKAELGRYLNGFLAVSLAGFAVMAVFPTAVVRPPAAGGLHSWILSYDLPGNAFPSLHAALAVYSALCCRPRRVWALIWAAAIVYSTLATKQHVFVDAAAGVFLGAAGFRWAYAGSRPSLRQGGMTDDRGTHDKRLQVA